MDFGAPGLLWHRSAVACEARRLPAIYRFGARLLRPASLALIVAQDAQAGSFVGQKGRRNVGRRQSALPGEAA